MQNRVDIKEVVDTTASIQQRRYNSVDITESIPQSRYNRSATGAKKQNQPRQSIIQFITLHPLPFPSAPATHLLLISLTFLMSRRTRNQDRILEILKSLEQAISAQDLYVELRDRDLSMGLATVYRALEALKLEGVVQARTIQNGEALYSLTQTDRHHLTCLQCGTSIAIAQCPVHDLETQLNQSYQFKIYYHMLEFYGLCTQCQAAEVPDEPPVQG
jgi:Fur family transcriptional regulator, ferric uptake regulator